MRLETFALERFQSIWENRVAWNVSESGVHPLRVAELADSTALPDALLDQELGCPQTNGPIELRQTIAGMFPGVTLDNVQVTNGGSEANCILLMHLVQPGDEIVFLTPNYMQASGLAKALGAIVRPWHLRSEGGAVGADRADRADGKRRAPDLDELKELVTPKTRAILFCNPNNPTGARLDAATLDEVCRAASAVGAWVVDDEISVGAHAR